MLLKHMEITASAFVLHSSHLKAFSLFLPNLLEEVAGGTSGQF